MKGCMARDAQTGPRAAKVHNLPARTHKTLHTSLSFHMDSYSIPDSNPCTKPTLPVSKALQIYRTTKNTSKDIYGVTVTENNIMGRLYH